MSDQFNPTDAQAVPPATGETNPVPPPVPGGEPAPSIDAGYGGSEGQQPPDYAALYEAERQRAAQLEAQQHQVFQAAHQLQEAQRQQALQRAQQRMAMEEQALLQHVAQSENSEEALRQMQQYYRAQNEQVLQLAQMYVTQQAQEKFVNQTLNEYGEDLTPEDRQYLSRINPNDLPVVAEQIRTRNRRERQLQEQLNRLQSQNQASQVMQSGAHRLGGFSSGVGTSQAGKRPDHIAPGSKEHLAWELGLLG